MTFLDVLSPLARPRQRRRRSIVGPDRAANWAALHRTIALVRPVVFGVGDALGYAYPHDLDATTAGYPRQLQHLA